MARAEGGRTVGDVVVPGADVAVAEVVVAPGTAVERVVTVRDRLWVGRQCAGVDETHRLLLDHESISRRHLEISLEPDDDGASVTDLSTNGTLLNGGRVQRAVPVPIRHGDRLRVGPFDLEFRSTRLSPRRPSEAFGGTARTTMGQAILVVGNIVDYGAVTERSTSAAVLGALRELFGGLRNLLAEHRGSVSNYVGDAFFAVWERVDSDDGDEAVTFALAASAFAERCAGSLPIRQGDGSPIRMGWAVVVGEAAVTSLSGGVVTAVGDATNRAFRIAGIAGRDGRAAVLVSAAITELLGDRVDAGPAETVALKGRPAPESVRPLRGLRGVRADPAIARPRG